MSPGAGVVRFITICVTVDLVQIPWLNYGYCNKNIVHLCLLQIKPKIEVITIES